MKTFKQTPYNTGKVQIGVNYHPKTNYVDPQGEKVQAALLGIESDFSKRRVRNFVFYVATIFVVYILLAAYAS